MFKLKHVYYTRDGDSVTYEGSIQTTAGERYMFSYVNDPSNWISVDYNGWFSHTRSTNLDIVGEADITKVSEEITQQGALKYDSGKPDLSLIPYAFLEQVTLALMYGEKKYARANYRKGFKSHRLVGACMRHLIKWFWIEELDDESGLSHLAHAAACLAMIIDCRSISTLDESDRPALKEVTQ